MIQNVKAKKILIRVEAFKTLMTIMYAKRVDSQNQDLIQAILSILFTLDPNEDLGMTQTITSYHKLVDSMKTMIVCTPQTRDSFLRFISESFDKHHSVECLKSILKLVCVGVGETISPDLEHLMFKVAKDGRVPLRDAIDGMLRKDIFINLSNTIAYGYAKTIYQKIDTAVAEK